MNKNIINAKSAKIKVQVYSEKAVEEELEKINTMIETASSDGEFRVFWKISPYLNEKQINIIMDFLTDNDYTMFSKELNKRNKLVVQAKREASTKIADIFNPKECVIIIDWKLSIEENIEKYSYFDMYNSKGSNRILNVY